MNFIIVEEKYFKILLFSVNIFADMPLFTEPQLMQILEFCSTIFTKNFKNAKIENKSMCGFLFFYFLINPLSTNLTIGQTHSNNSPAICRRIVWVCLTILCNFWDFQQRNREWLWDCYERKMESKQWSPIHIFGTWDPMFQFK